MLLHATCVALEGQGVLLLGPPGSGKSDLALRLIDLGAQLVADDQVQLCLMDDAIVAFAPEKLHGLLEVRGVGILTLDHLPQVPVQLAVQLVPREQVERLPGPQRFICMGHEIPLHSLHAFDVSTALKVCLALRQQGAC